jgi:uncharacterized membrane protein
MKRLMYGLILVLIGLLLLSLVSFGCYRLSFLNLDVKKDIAIISIYGLFSFAFGFYLILQYFEERVKFK